MLFRKINMSKKDEIQLVLAEYSALRQEILKRIEARYQLISLTLIIAGTILTFGLQPDSPSAILFVFPILSAFLASIWSHNLRMIRRVSNFIRDHIEAKYIATGWEGAIKDEVYSLSWLSGIIASSGIFLGTEIITLMLGLLKSTFTTIDISLVSIDILAMIFTIIALRSTTIRPKTKAGN
jgi:hypothetical protein